MSDLLDDLFGHGFSEQFISDQEAYNHNMNLLMDMLFPIPKPTRWQRFVAWLRRLW